MGGKGAKRKQRNNRDELTSIARESRRLVVQVQEVTRTCNCPAWQRHHHSCAQNAVEEDATQISILETIERRVRARQEPLRNQTEATGSPPSKPVAHTGYQPYNLLNGEQRSRPADGAATRNEDAGASLPGSCGATATTAAAASSRQPAAAASSSTAAACRNADGIYYADL